jgi:hypothetical protein
MLGGGLAMPNYSVHKASELASDESVSVNAIRPHGMPSEVERAALRREILAQAEEIGSRGPEASEEVARALVEDALSALRGRRGWRRTSEMCLNWWNRAFPDGW